MYGIVAFVTLPGMTGKINLTIWQHRMNHVNKRGRVRTLERLRLTSSTQREHDYLNIRKVEIKQFYSRGNATVISLKLIAKGNCVSTS